MFKQDKKLWLLYIAILLMFSLRADHVGRDLFGYHRIYFLTSSVDWSNYTYVYFEKGYVFLMKICSAAGFRFRWFLALCSAITLIPIYLFCNRYSKNKYMSLYIFVCYIYFEFAFTAVRQAMSMSIVLLGYMILASKVKGKYLYYIAIVYLASLFHKGALICYLILPFIAIDSITIFTLLVIFGGAVALASRSFLFSYMKRVFGKASFNENAELHIGLNLLLLVVMAVWFFYVLVEEKKKRTADGDSFRDDPDLLFFKMYFISIITALFFGSETSARSYMYFNQTVIVLIPNILKMTSMKKKQYFEFMLISFFAVFFVWNTLMKNNFDIVPYRFYWQR